MPSRSKWEKNERKAIIIKNGSIKYNGNDNNTPNLIVWVILLCFKLSIINIKIIGIIIYRMYIYLNNTVKLIVKIDKTSNI